MQVVLNSENGVSVVNHTSSMPYINNNDNTLTGQIRYKNYSFQIYDGYAWVNIPQPSFTIGLDTQTQSMIDYINKLQDREIRLKERANDTPAIADLLRQRNEIDDKLNMIDTLIK